VGEQAGKMEMGIALVEECGGSRKMVEEVLRKERYGEQIRYAC
jgi:hypothetical protein